MKSKQTSESPLSINYAWAYAINKTHVSRQHEQRMISPITENTNGESGYIKSKFVLYSSFVESWVLSRNLRHLEMRFFVVACLYYLQMNKRNRMMYAGYIWRPQIELFCHIRPLIFKRSETITTCEKLQTGSICQQTSRPAALVDLQSAWRPSVATCYCRRSFVCCCRPATLKQSTCRRPFCPVTHNISSETEKSLVSEIVSRHCFLTASP